MKRYTHIIISLALAFCIIGCENPESIPMAKVTINDTWTTTASTASMTGTFTSSATITQVSVLIGTKADFSDAKAWTVTLNKSAANVKVTGLKAETEYYYRYLCSNSVNSISLDVKTFTTDKYTVPEVETTEAKLIINSKISVRFEGEIFTDGDKPITEYGFCYSRTGTPNINRDSLIRFTDNALIFDATKTLTYGEIVNVRAYAVNSQGAGYGSTLTVTAPTGEVTFGTIQVKNIKVNSAEAVKTFRNDGGLPFKKEGWIINTPDMSFTREITSGNTLNNLTPNTLYQLKAFVENMRGRYVSELVEFTTTDGVVTFGSTNISNVTESSVKATVQITSDGGANITERGFCYSTTNTTPTLSDSSKKSTQTNSTYSAEIQATDNTRLYIRPYAINSTGIYYGTVVSACTTPAGVLPGVFSVSATKKVRASKGNLQYQASTNTWRFAANQLTYIGMDNENISATYSGWIDLFGWGTGDCPTKISLNANDYTTFVDWCKNPISNGGNQANLWRSLTSTEIDYMTRTGNYGDAQVGNVEGVVILPDNWVLPSGCTFTAGFSYGYTADYNYTPANVYTSAQWTKMEAAGALFLPVAGIRTYSSYKNAPAYYSGEGCYWFSTFTEGVVWSGFWYYNGTVQPVSYDATRAAGCAVRAFLDVE